VLYVKNLKEAVTEEKLKEIFAPHGEIDRVKKVKDYAFVHYKERDSAIKAIDALNNTEVEGIAIEIALAKPQAENKQKKKFGGPSSMRGMFGAGGGGGKRGLRGSFGEPFGVPPRGGRGRGGAFPPAGPYGGYGYDPYAGYPPYGGGYPGYDMYGYPAADP
jgi:hypothetical protein